MKKFSIEKSFRFGIEKIRYQKSLGFGIENIWYRKKYGIRFRSDFGYHHTLIFRLASYQGQCSLQKHNVSNHSEISSVHVPIPSGLQCLLQGYSVNSIHPQHKAYSPLLKALGSKFSSGQEQGHARP